MAKITISNLPTSGNELFIDSESYLNELSDAELEMTKGGCFMHPRTILRTTSIITILF